MSSPASRRQRGPAPRSLEEMPEIDFSRYRVRRNPFASAIMAHGIEVLHDDPSPSSLKAMPEADMTRVVVRKNPYSKR